MATAEVAVVGLPKVVDRSQAEAEQALRSVGFEVEVQTRAGPEDEVGKIVEQIPSGGGEADKSVAVVIVEVAWAPPLEEQLVLPATGGFASLTSTLEGHSGGVWSVAMSPDGSLLANGGSDGIVELLVRAGGG